MSRWSIEIYNSLGQRMADLSSKSLERKLVRARNRSDIINLKYDLDEIKKLCRKIGVPAFELFAVNQNEIRFKRDGVVLGAGQIVDTTPSITEDVRTIDIKGLGWFDLLGTRYTDVLRRFEQVDAGEIAWTTIDESQQKPDGDFGITLGNIQTSIPHDITYEFKNIKELITQLSEVENGFDFEITWDKVFNVYYPAIGQLRDDIILSYPGNISSLSFNRRGLETANQVIARGAGDGGNNIYSIVDEPVSQGKYSLRQAILQYNDIFVEDILRAHAQAELLIRSDFIDIPTVTLKSSRRPAYGDYSVGDIVPIKTSDRDIFEPINDLFKIEMIDLTLDENDQENVVLGLVR